MKISAGGQFWDTVYVPTEKVCHAGSMLGPRAGCSFAADSQCEFHIGRTSLLIEFRLNVLMPKHRAASSCCPSRDDTCLCNVICN